MTGYGDVGVTTPRAHEIYVNMVMSQISEYSLASQFKELYLNC